VSDEVPWRRLHGASVAVNLVPRLFSAARAAWPLLLAWAWGRLSGTGAFDLLLLGLFVVPSVASTVLHWATLRYRLNGDRLEIESGLLLRTQRSIARDRVQNVEVVRNVFHRLAGLAEVRVETASGREVEGLLSALALSDADALVSALGRRGVVPAGSTEGPAAEETAAPAPAEEVLATVGWTELLWSGLTALRPATVGVGAWAAYELLLLRAGPDDPANGAVAVVVGSAPSVALALLVATGAFGVAVGTTVLRHAGFRLVARGDALAIEEGLLTRRRSELRRERVQLVVFEQGLVRRLLGFGTLAIETAAARSEGDGTERSSAQVPWVDGAAAAPLVGRVLPAGSDPAALELSAPHPSAGWRAAWPRTVAALVGAVVVTATVGTTGALAFLVVPVVALVTHQQAAAERWAVTDELVASRTGWFWTRRTTLVPRRRVQSVATITTPWLERAGLARVAVRIAGRSLTLPLMHRDEAAGLLSRLSRAAG
jgi:putative membrane protein